MADFDFIKTKFKFPSSLEVNFDFGAGNYKLLAGNSNIISAIWADLNANRVNGKFYITSYGIGAACSIIDLKLKILYDRYTITEKGRSNQTLIQNDPKDIVI